MSSVDYKGVFSGTTASAAGTNVFGTQLTGLQRCADISVTADLIGATGGTLDVYLQRFDVELNNWVDWVHFAQLAAGAAAVRYTLNAAAAQNSVSIVTVGLGTSPALAAGTATGGHPGDQIRCLVVSGVSTSAGAAIKISVRGYK